MDNYSVFVVAQAPVNVEPIPDPDTATDFLTDELSHHDGFGGANSTSWDATLSVWATNATQAHAEALDVVRKAARNAGVPEWPIVDVRVVREDILDAEQSRPNIPDLVSGPEVAEILGVVRQRIHQLAHQRPDFPKPLYRLGVGSLWERGAIERFARGWERRPGRPPKYAPLTDWLAEAGDNRITMQFDDVERVIGSALPRSAVSHREWWGNDTSHSQAQAWLSAGFEVEEVDRGDRRVVFHRTHDAPLPRDRHRLKA